MSRKKLLYGFLGIVGFALLIWLAYRIPSERDKPSTLTIYNLVIWSPDLVASFEDICREWGHENDVSVNIEQVKLEEIDAKLASLIDSGVGADLAVFPAHKIPIYSSELQDMSRLAEQIGRPFGGYYDIAKDMTAVDGRSFGIPLYAWSHLWVYNGALLDKYALQPAQTFDEAEEIAKTIAQKEPGSFPFGIGLGKDDDAAMFLQSLLWAYGGKIVSDDGRTVTIRSEETKAAINYIVRLYEVSKVIPPGAFGWDGASNNKNFLAGQIAFTMNSPTILVAARKDKPELAKTIRHTVYPAGPNGRFSYATGFAFGAPKSTKKLALVESLLRYFYEPDRYKRLISAGGGAVNPWLHGCETLPLWKDPQLKPGLDSLKIEKHLGWPGPVTAAAAEVFERRILAGMVNDVINNSMSVDDALAQAENSVREIYQRQRESDEK